MWESLQRHRAMSHRLYEWHRGWQYTFAGFRARQFLVWRRLWRHTKPRAKRFHYYREHQQFMDNYAQLKAKESVTFY